MVDFIDMEQEEDKKALLDCLKQAVSTDPVRTVVVDMTPLGLVELTRKGKKTAGFMNRRDKPMTGCGGIKTYEDHNCCLR